MATSAYTVSISEIPPPARTLPLDAFRTAKLMLDQHGATEAWRMLTIRAIDDHTAGRVGHRDITQQVLSALHTLTRGPGPDEPLQ